MSFVEKPEVSILQSQTYVIPSYLLVCKDEDAVLLAHELFLAFVVLCLIRF